MMRRNKTTFFERIEMDEVSYEITRWIDRLDQTGIDYEARWGCNRLPLLVDADTAAKWSRQWAKLDEAIEERNLSLVRELAEGCIRAWAFIEKKAIDAGHKPIAPDAWEIQHPDSGRVYRIVKTRNDAYAPAPQNTVTYSLEETARILETKNI